RHDILAGRGGRRHQRVVRAGERDDQCRGRLGEHVRISRRVAEQHFADTVKLGRSLRDRFAVLAGNQNVDFATDLFRGGQRFVGRVLGGGVVVLGDERGGHISPLPPL